MTDMSPKPKLEEAENESQPSEEEPQNETEVDPKASAKPAAKRRTKTGCLTCRKRRIKCSEEKPFCKNCIKSKRECAGYVQPLVYKQQQGLTGHDATRRSSTTELDFQFNHGFGPMARSAHADLGVFNPFSPYYDQYGQPVRDRHSTSTVSTYQYPDPADVVTHEATAYPFDTFKRHSFHDPNTQHFGYHATQFQAHSPEGPNEWFQRLQHPAHQPYPYHATYNPAPNTMSAHMGYLESYAESSAGNPAPAHGPFPRRYSMHGFLQTGHRPPRVPHLIMPDLKIGGASYEDDPFDIDMDDSTSEPDEHDLEQHEHQSRAQKFTRGGPPISGVPNGHRSGTLRSTKQSAPLSPLFDERNERVFRHFVEVLGSCLSTFERPSPDPWASPRQNLWCFTLASAAFSNPALAHAILAVSGLHISKLQQTSDSMSLKHFTYAARRVGRLMNLTGKRHEPTTLATVLLLGYYEILNADHSRWNLHLAGATKLVAEHDLSTLAREVRRTRAHAVEVAMSSTNTTGAPLSAQDCAQYGFAPSLLDDTEWSIDQALIRDLSGLEIDYDCSDTETPVSPTMTEAEIATYRTKVDLWWWFCKQDLFQSMVSGERLLMPLEYRAMCPPRGQINVVDKPYATFDHLVLIFSRLSDFGGKDRHRKQRAILAQGGQWKPPDWLSVSGPPNPASDAKFERRLPTKPSNRDPPSRQPELLAEEIEMRDQHRTPSANEGRVRQSKTGSVSHIPTDGPQMFGMMPPPSRPPKMHSAFHLMERSINQGAPHGKLTRSAEDIQKSSLEEETAAAHAEHKRITEAFDLFYRSLGPEFHSIPNEGEHTSSPFGPPLRYQSPEIACVWAHYWVGRVLLHRLHPDMPPAAMVAAGVTAGLTRSYTQIVGQICAGLFASIPSGPPGQPPLSPRFACSLMEISFPLLFCGVQFTDMSQRGWTISKLHDIAQMTGWQTSAAVAAACEIAWEKLAQAGRGPPYARSLDRNNKDVRVNGSLRHLTPQLSASISDAESEHESQFVSHDRALISKHGPSRVHWAMGLLSVEDDVRQMNIGAE